MKTKRIRINNEGEREGGGGRKKERNIYREIPLPTLVRFYM